ncbi:peptide deformylase [Sphingobacterium hungaricum]
MIRPHLILICVLPFLSMAQDYSKEIEAYRQKKALDFSKNSFGPLRAENVSYLAYYAPDENYKVQAKVEILENEVSFRMPTYDGTSNEYIRYALLHFELNGQPHTLTAYQSVSLFQNPAYITHLFLPFLDETNANETYAGGRYIDLDSKNISNNTIQIDFNTSYNPYCAYSSGYRCPQPPQENTLQTRILAGEKSYLGPKNDRIVDTEKASTFSDREKEIILNGNATDILHVYLVTDEEENTVLKTPSQDIKPNDPLLKVLASRMLKTVQDPKTKGVGIAAPQVGINKNAIWVQRFDKANQPFEFFINPKIIWRSALTRKGAEGCLSIPDRKEDVLRNYAIRLQYWTEDGKVKEENIEGFTAVILQHEVDHLYGILYPDRLVEQEGKEYLPLNEKLNFSVPKGSLMP